MTCSCQWILRVCRHGWRALHRRASQGLSRRERSVLERRSQQPLTALFAARRLCIGLQRKLSLSVLLEQWTTKGRALQDSLDQLVLLQRFREILIHLGLDALFSIAHHGVCRQGNDGGSVRSHAPLVLANLAGGLETSLVKVSTYRIIFRHKSYHDRHLNIHENHIKLLLLDGFHSLPTVAHHGDDVVVLFENLDS